MMVDEAKTGSLPVSSEDVKKDILAAFARIEQVPAGRNLIDDLSSEMWHDDLDEIIMAGSDIEDDELDTFDEEVRKVA